MTENVLDASMDYIEVPKMDFEDTIEVAYEKLKSENKKLKEYVKHKDDCFKIRDIQPKTDQCSCGLDDILRDNK